MLSFYLHVMGRSKQPDSKPNRYEFNFLYRYWIECAYNIWVSVKCL